MAAAAHSAGKPAEAEKELRDLVAAEAALFGGTWHPPIVRAVVERICAAFSAQGASMDLAVAVHSTHDVASL